MDSEQGGEETQQDGEPHGVGVAEWEDGVGLKTSVPQQGSGVMCGHCVALTITMTSSGHRLAPIPQYGCRHYGYTVYCGHRPEQMICLEYCIPMRIQNYRYNDKYRYSTYSLYRLDCPNLGVSKMYR